MSTIIEKLKPARHQNGNGEADRGVAVTLLTVTPSVAAELLEHKRRNRKVSDKRVAEYAHMMRRNKWVDGQADICLDTEGKLINGQHTLTAVMRSGRTIVVTLKTGMPPRSMDSLDSHRARKVSDQLQIEGFTNATTVAPTALVVMRWRQEGSPPGLTQWGQTVKSADIDRLQHLAYCRKHKDELESAAALAKSRAAKTKLLSPSMIAGLQIMFTDYAPAHGEAWLAELFDETSSVSQPVAAYRQKLIQLRGTNNEWSGSLKLAFAIKSFNAYMARREMKLFRLKPNEQVNVDVPEGVN
jgi:hypothetical protein